MRSRRTAAPPGDGVRLVQPDGIERDIRSSLDPTGGIAGGAAMVDQHQARRFFRIDVEEFVHQSGTDQDNKPRIYADSHGFFILIPAVS